MKTLERALYELNHVESSAHSESFLHSIDVRAKIIVTLFYIVAVLSFSLTSLTGIMIFALVPILMSALSDMEFARVFGRSLYVLPFIIFIGVFNPIFNRTPAFMVGGIVVSEGWVEFVSVVLRGLLTVQMVLLLIMTSGFFKVCRGLGAMKVPGVFITQLVLLYRYIFVLVEEAITMDRARRARSYGNGKYSLSMWGAFVGQLLIRSFRRAERIHQAMLSRGFTGQFDSLNSLHWRMRDTLFVLASVGVMVVLRLVDFNMLISKLG